MVLEALSGSLPDAVFFTNNLDARFAHRDEWRWTRNLIVASPFGLTLKERYQKVPPFRDSIQTAMYAATLLAANYKNIGQTFSKASLGPVRLYEIGRRGAFDLTRDVPADSLQPPSLDLRRWWNWNRFVWALLIVVMLLGAAVWILRKIIGPPAKNNSHKAESRQPVWRSAWLMFLFFAGISTVLIWVISSISSWRGTDHEPYSWIDGISVWPTETFRLLVFCLSCFYILRTSRAVLENEVDLEKHFGFTHSHEETRSSRNWWSRFRQTFSMTLWKKLWKQAHSQGWWDKLFRQMTPYKWKYQKNDGRVSADKLWTCYADCGEEGVRWARIVPLVVLYVFAGLF
jgi:hypothetical protein